MLSNRGGSSALPSRHESCFLHLQNVCASQPNPVQSISVRLLHRCNLPNNVPYPLNPLSTETVHTDLRRLNNQSRFDACLEKSDRTNSVCVHFKINTMFIFTACVFPWNVVEEVVMRGEAAKNSQHFSQGHIWMVPNCASTSDMGLNPSWLFLPIFLLCFASLLCSYPARQSECNLPLPLTLNASMTPRAKWVNWWLAGDISCRDRGRLSKTYQWLSNTTSSLSFLNGDRWSCLLPDCHITQQEMWSEFQSKFLSCAYLQQLQTAG